MRVVKNMNKTVQTKFLPATDFRGSRVKAWHEGGLSVIVSYDHALNSDDNHIEAVKALLKKMNWDNVKIIRQAYLPKRGFIHLLEW